MTQAQAGELLREWRQRRRLSQLDLAIAADVSSRHLSFVETGRARPTSEMILRLAEHLDVPLRDRNALLLAGGYAPAYPERALAEPELKRSVTAALQRVLEGHRPTRPWWSTAGGSWSTPTTGIALFTQHDSTGLLEPPVNVLRLSLHPDGMAPRIANLPEWRAHLLARLHRQAEATGDPGSPPCTTSSPPTRAAGQDRPPRPTSWSRSATAPTRRTVLHQHHRRGRHADGHHRRGTGHRVVLPRRRGDRRRPAPVTADRLGRAALNRATLDRQLLLRRPRCPPGPRSGT